MPNRVTRESQAIESEVHTRALRLVSPNGRVASPRVQSIRERRVAVFSTLAKVIRDCRDARVSKADALRFAESGVWLVHQIYDDEPQQPPRAA